MEYEQNCLPTCKLDENNNKINHLQNDSNDDSVSNKAIIPAGDLSELNPSVISNIHLHYHPDENSFKDKETKSLLSVKTEHNNPKEIDRKKHVITVITQSSKTNCNPIRYPKFKPLF